MFGSRGRLDPTTLPPAHDVRLGIPSSHFGHSKNGDFDIRQRAIGCRKIIASTGNEPVPLSLDARVIAVGWERYWISDITSGTSIHNRGGNPQNSALGVGSTP